MCWQLTLRQHTQPRIYLELYFHFFTSTNDWWDGFYSHSLSRSKLGSVRRKFQTCGRWPAETEGIVCRFKPKCKNLWLITSGREVIGPWFKSVVKNCQNYTILHDWTESRKRYEKKKQSDSYPNNTWTILPSFWMSCENFSTLDQNIHTLHDNSKFQFYSQRNGI